MAKNILTENFSELLNGAVTAKIDINVGDGNLMIDPLASSEQVLARGTLQYLEKQGLPAHTLASSNGQTTFMLKAGRGGQPWFRFPWSACNGATEWQIYLNPTVSSDLAAHSDGGNLKLDLTGMLIARVSAETGGGNVNLVLPEDAADLSVAVRTGGGNVTVEMGSDTKGINIVNAKSGAGNALVRIPNSIAARIHAATGLGKVIIDPRFIKTDDNTYQSSDFDGAANRVEMIVHSGAGNVTVDTK